MPGAIKLLKIVRMLKPARKIVAAKWDGERVAVKGHVDFEAKFPPRIMIDASIMAGQAHGVFAARRAYGEPEDCSIEIDGMEQADADLDIKAKFRRGRLRIAYVLQYHDDDEVLHTLRLFAFVSWKQLLGI